MTTPWPMTARGSTWLMRPSSPPERHAAAERQPQQADLPRGAERGAAGEDVVAAPLDLVEQRAVDRGERQRAHARAAPHERGEPLAAREQEPRARHLEGAERAPRRVD